MKRLISFSLGIFITLCMIVAANAGRGVMSIPVRA